MEAKVDRKDCYCMKTMGKLNRLPIFFRCPFHWVWIPECSGISRFLLSFKFLHFHLSSWRNIPPTMCKYFHQMRCLKGISVKMNGSAQFRNRGEVWTKYTFSIAVNSWEKHFFKKTFPLIYFGQYSLIVVMIYLTKDILHCSPSQTKILILDLKTYTWWKDQPT